MAESVINGTDLYCFIEGVAIAHATNHTLSIKTAVIPTSNKDTGLYATKIPGRSDVTVTCEGFVAYGDFETVVNAKIARLPVTLSLGKKSAGALDLGSPYFTGEFIITSYEMSAADNAVATYNVTFDHYTDFAFNIYGPELINQTAWYTAAYWNNTFDAVWSQSGVTLVCTNSGWCIRNNFWTIGKTYRIEYTCTWTYGRYDGPMDGLSFSISTTTGSETKITTTYIPGAVELCMRSASFVGTVTALSVREVL